MRFTEIYDTLKKLAPIVLMGILALTACGDSASNSSTGSFESPEDLVGAINDNTDLTCSTDIIETQGSLDSDESWDSMRCDDKGIVHYLQSDGAKSFLLEWLQENETSNKRIALGDDWIFVGHHHTDAHDVRTALDGLQPHFPGFRSGSGQETAPEDPKSEDVSESPIASETPEQTFESDIEFSGAGDDIVEVDIPEDVPAIAYITHDGSSNFQVTGYTSDGDRAEGLVNEIGVYEGTRPLNLQEPAVQELDITADGSWHIAIQPLFEAQPIEATGATEGSDDAVLLVADNETGSVEVSHEGESNFQVTAWGDGRSGMINEIGAYDGRVRMPTDAVILEIVADGSWSFNFD